jgi:probable rRNA maturation factor
MILDQQNRIALRRPPLRRFVAQLCPELNVKPDCFNVCLVDDREIRRLNAQFRGHDRPTDVLSFPWQSGDGTSGVDARSPAALGGAGNANREFDGFIGDIVISVETAQRQARAEGHPTETEVSWLILHGLLHLLGYDHETDHGEMEAREIELRARLGISGNEGNG